MKANYMGVRMAVPIFYLITVYYEFTWIFISRPDMKVNKSLTGIDFKLYSGTTIS